METSTPNQGKTKPILKDDGTFRNPWSSLERRGVTDLLKWKLFGSTSAPKFPSKEEVKLKLPSVDEPSWKTICQFGNRIRSSNRDSVGIEGRDNCIEAIPLLTTWIGHSTFLVQCGGVNVLTDPVFSKRCSPVSFAGPKRMTPLLLDVKHLSCRVHVVTISHNHYDHLDTQSIMELIQYHDHPIFIVPLGMKRWFSSLSVPPPSSEVDIKRNSDDTPNNMDDDASALPSCFSSPTCPEGTTEETKNDNVKGHTKRKNMVQLSRVIELNWYDEAKVTLGMITEAATRQMSAKEEGTLNNKKRRKEAQCEQNSEVPSSEKGEQMEGNQNEEMIVLAVTAVPVQHWSMRSGPWDRYRELWCGFVWDFLPPPTDDDDDGGGGGGETCQKEKEKKTRKKRVFHCGDTGYNDEVFKEIGSHFGPIDFAMIPIGAYSPRAFMRPQHIDPSEAVKIHVEIGSRVSVGMHWGTFILTDEPIDEPPLLLSTSIDEHNNQLLQQQDQDDASISPTLVNGPIHQRHDIIGTSTESNRKEVLETVEDEFRCVHEGRGLVVVGTVEGDAVAVGSLKEKVEETVEEKEEKDDDNEVIDCEVDQLLTVSCCSSQSSFLVMKNGESIVVH